MRGFGGRAEASGPLQDGRMQAPGFEPGRLAFFDGLEGQGPTRLDYACRPARTSP